MNNTLTDCICNIPLYPDECPWRAASGHFLVSLEQKERTPELKTFRHKEIHKLMSANSVV